MESKPFLFTIQLLELLNIHLCTTLYYIHDLFITIIIYIRFRMSLCQYTWHADNIILFFHPLLSLMYVCTVCVSVIRHHYLYTIYTSTSIRPILQLSIRNSQTTFQSVIYIYWILIANKVKYIIHCLTLYYTFHVCIFIDRIWDTCTLRQWNELQFGESKDGEPK